VAEYYLDSSAIVKRYIVEPGSNWVSRLFAPTAGHVLNTVRVTGAEIIAAFALRARTGTLTVADAQTAALQFRAEYRTRYRIVEVTEALIDLAMALAERHGLRGYDAVQLAAGLELNSLRSSLPLAALTFVSADDRLNAVANAEGLLVENPNHHEPP